MTNSDTPAVRITDLGKTYPGAASPALSGVSLSVEPGEIVVLLGLSGSGKSTLLRHVNGLETPTEGKVVSLGETVSDLRGRALRGLRGRIGFIFQQFELVGALTVLENVLTGGLSTLRGPRVGIFTYPRACARRLSATSTESVCSSSPISGPTSSPAASSSASASPAHSCRIRRSCSPTNRSPPSTRSRAARSMSLIREIAAERALTVICSLHQVDLALSWGDRILGLRAGQVVLDTHTDSLTREEVMEIYGRVATTTSEIEALEDELAEAREQVLSQEMRRSARDRFAEDLANEEPA